MKNKKIFFLFIFYISLLFIFSAKEEFLKIYSEYDSNKIEYYFYADNSHFVPYNVKIEFNVLENLKSSVDIPYSCLIKPGSKKVLLFYLYAIDKNKSIKYSYFYKYSPGDPTAKHDDNYLYIFPFEHGTKRQLAQGFHGKKTHFEQNEFGVDFDMPIGTPVMAARDGIVVEVKEDSNVGGTSQYYEDKANYIAIYHNDGSFSYYVHLKKDGVIVNVGDKVITGQLIGYSGNTGHSSGPHLHFDVRVATNEGTLQSIPFKFLNYNSKGIEPKEGLFYYSFHPGKPKFEILLGINIKNEDYENHSLSIPNNNKIEIRTEQIDETTLVFVKNGFNEKYEIKLELNLINLTASKQIPIIKTVPPLKEIYLLFLRKKELSEPFQYSFNYSYRVVK